MQEQDLGEPEENKASELSEVPDRGHWASRWEFLFSCMGLSIGIGNVWRFPYLAYENGGGAFLLPFVIILLLIGQPIYVVEVAIGQYCQSGPTRVWRLAPIAKGLGVAVILANVFVSIYYNAIMCYTLYYMFASWTSKLPWGGCYAWWGADNKTCFVHRANVTQLPQCSNLEKDGVKNYTVGINCTDIKLQTASEQYWERHVLNIREEGLTNFGNIGSLKWDLCLCNLLAWLIIFLCMLKGIKTSGKVVYFTATFPFLILIVLAVHGLTQPGALEGMKFFFVPTWEKILTVQVWHAAAEQVFYSLSISWGTLIMLGSYNKFNNKVHMDAYAVCWLDFLTSILAGCAIFTVLGSWSLKMNVPIDQVVKQGQGLAFVAYPEAITGLPVPQLWSTLFFLMLFTLGLDSQFAGFETILTGMYDIYPHLRKKKTLFTLGWCCVFYLLGLPCLTETGAYIIDIMDIWTGLSVLCIGVFEMIALMWIYGVKRLVGDFEYMLGFRFNYYWQICWGIIAPLGLTIIFISGFIFWENPTYGDLSYPDWALALGWLLYLTVVLPIPIMAIYVLFTTRKNLKNALRPTPSWGPGGKPKSSLILQTDPKRDFAFDNPAPPLKEN